jgi:CheY-like chemotaxis protein
MSSINHDKPQSADGRLETQRVLAFDHKALVRALGPEVLRQRGIEILTFKTGREAIELAAVSPPSLCLVPLTLPDMESRTLASRLHEMHGPEAVSVVALLERDTPDPGPLDPRFFAGTAHLPLEPKEFNVLMGRLLGVHLRQAERFPIRVRVFSKEYMGTTIDLSSTGMLVKTDEALEPGTSVEIQFALPGSAQRMGVTARVIRVDKQSNGAVDGVAFRFDPLSYTDKRRLEDYIESLVSGRTFAWHLEEGKQRTTAVLVGRLKDPEDLLELSTQIHRPVDLNLSRLKRIEKPCIEPWVGWLRGLGQIEHPVNVSAAAYTLAQQGAQDPRIFTGCQVEKIAVAHVCEACGNETEVLVALRKAKKDAPQTIPCPRCGGTLTPDDPIPELQSDPSARHES